MSLRPCSGCGRHVRASETSCPFCATTLEAVADAPARAVGRVGRAALFAFGAAAAVTSVGACDGGTTPAPDAAPMVDTGGPTPLYGGPADVGPMDDAGNDAGNVAPAYGTPADDAGTDAGLVAMYGGPPGDAGIDAGAVAPLYGGSPGA